MGSSKTVPRYATPAEWEMIVGAWSGRAALKRLADFAHYQLTERSYDGHGHEELQICVDRAREILCTEQDGAEEGGASVSMPLCPDDNPATCIGVCEGNVVSYGCDTCCAHCDVGDERCKPHQHEEGYCYALVDVPEWIGDLLKSVAEGGGA